MLIIRAPFPPHLPLVLEKAVIMAQPMALEPNSPITSRPSGENTRVSLKMYAVLELFVYHIVVGLITEADKESKIPQGIYL